MYYYFTKIHSGVQLFMKSEFYLLYNVHPLLPHGMCYSHYGNGVRNGAISIAQWGLLSDCYKVNPIGQWGKILVILMGFVDMLGLEY